MDKILSCRRLVKNRVHLSHSSSENGDGARAVAARSTHVGLRLKTAAAGPRRMDSAVGDLSDILHRISIKNESNGPAICCRSVRARLGPLTATQPSSDPPRAGCCAPRRRTTNGHDRRRPPCNRRSSRRRIHGRETQGSKQREKQTLAGL